MPLVLVIGSHVAGSRVGGTVANLALALSPAQVDPVFVPTTLLGRHPGWGPPGGGAVPLETMAGMLEGIAANGLFGLMDGILCDYHASADQVALTARTIDAVRAARPEVTVLVDPVMGDDGALYVPETVADAIARELVPRASLVTPNLTELVRLTGGGPVPGNPAAVAARARLLGCPALVTSVPVGDPGRTGTLWVDPARPEGWLFTHERLETGLRGTGDLLSACLLARLLEGLDGPAAAAHATATVAEIVRLAVRWGAPELPVVGAREAWLAAPLEPVGVQA